MPFQTLHGLLVWLLISLPSHTSILPVTDTTYEVELTLEPPVGVVENVLTSIDMYSKHGQKFMCHIPDIRTKNQTTEAPQINDSYVKSLLGIDYRSACMLLKKGWWVYELCPYRHMLQFHQNGKTRVSEILLGSFDSESKWDDPLNETAQTPLKHKQWYTNGSLCDITYRQRQVEVRYECADLSTSGIIKVEEVETCVYTVDVSIPALCSHPLFAAQVPTTSERIICSPETPIAKVYDTEPLKTQTSSPIELHKSNRTDAFTLMRTRRSRTNYRIVRRLLRKFIRTISSPIPDSASFGVQNAFNIYLQNTQSHSFCSTSFGFAVDRSELQPWISHGTQFVQRFYQIIYEAVSHSSLKSSRIVSLQPTVRIVRSLATLLTNLLYYKYKQVSHPAFFGSPVHQQFANASQLLIQIFDELYNNMGSDFNLTIQLEKDLQSMYLDPEFAPLPSDLSLETSGPDGDTPVSVRLAIKKRGPLCRTPVEASKLSDLIDSFGRSTGLLQRFQDTLTQLERVRSMEATLSSALQDLATGHQLRVLVVRGSNPENNPDGAADSSSDSSDPSAPLSQSVLAMVKKVIQDMAPQSSGPMEVYETHNGQGFATVFVVSGEDKRKEEQRMKTLEEAYNYVPPNQPHQNG